ncbi:MAG: KpsF/GutQ family sugar-phosphate isomerase [Planctomycetes bacterium]|nr:KpsF/GutQ family sugar-phosphate isomerase [Planctomycetota bacterium]
MDRVTAPAVDVAYARSVIEAEAAAVKGLLACLDEAFDKAVRMVYECRGNVVLSGIGKAGIVAQKTSATLCSTGTPSIFLHAAEAIHGDLGRVRRNDVVLIYSYGGETDEVSRLLQQLKKMGTPIIAMTGRPQSTLGRYADVVLNLGDLQEACPLGLAPSVTTTAMLALGDALALTVLKMHNFKEEDFALFHPGGSLGRKLLKVEDVMRKDDRLPVARDNLTVREVLCSLTRIKRRSGAAVLVDAAGKLTGIFVDADLRRMLEGGDATVLDRLVAEVMVRNPKRILADRLASEALHIINEYHIDELPVVDGKDRVVGLVDIQDLVEVGLAEA